MSYVDAAPGIASTYTAAVRRNTVLYAQLTTAEFSRYTAAQLNTSPYESVCFTPTFRLTFLAANLNATVINTCV